MDILTSICKIVKIKKIAHFIWVTHSTENLGKPNKSFYK